jgi:granzyme M
MDETVLYSQGAGDLCCNSYSHRVQRLRLVLGLHDLHNPHAPGLTFHIKAAIRHPGYNLHLENDLMLLKVRGWRG